MVYILDLILQTFIILNSVQVIQLSTTRNQRIKEYNANAGDIYYTYANSLYIQHHRLFFGDLIMADV